MMSTQFEPHAMKILRLVALKKAEEMIILIASYYPGAD